MTHQFFRKEIEIVNITYHKIYILNIHANSQNSGTVILRTQHKQDTPKPRIISMTIYISEYRSLLTKSSEVPNLSSSKD